MGSHREVSSLPLGVEFEVFTDNNSLFYFRTAPWVPLSEDRPPNLSSFTSL